MYITLKKASELTGLSTVTLRKYADTKTIPSITLPSGHRRVDVRGILRDREEVICYARVSSRKQSDDLSRQVETLRSEFPGSEVVSDIASGLNFKRKGLNTILVRLLRGDKLTLVVTHRDRLARFGFELIEFLIQENGGKLVVLNNGSVEPSPESKLTTDLLSILHHFSCRAYGHRSHQNTKNPCEPDCAAAGHTEEVVRGE